MLLLTVVSLCENLHLKKNTCICMCGCSLIFVNLQQLTNNLAYTPEGEQCVNMV